MRVLVVSHPDDEVLWFGDPSRFDRIIICFLGVPDRAYMKERREKALREHPLAGKITCLGFDEPEIHLNGERERLVAKLALALRAVVVPSSVTTHCAFGEYGNHHHKLVFSACMEAFDCPVNDTPPNLYRDIRACYYRNACWTWDT